MPKDVKETLDSSYVVSNKASGYMHNLHFQRYMKPSFFLHASENLRTCPLILIADKLFLFEIILSFRQSKSGLDISKVGYFAGFINSASANYLKWVGNVIEKLISPSQLCMEDC